MNKSGYEIIKSLQLKNANSKFVFSEQMRNASNNNFWKNKKQLWKILSASCDEAAKKCYQKINSLTSDVADIQTCNIHSLISIGNSIGANDVVNDIITNYEDLDIQELVNLFSVKKQILLNSNQILDDSANNKISGYLLLRGLNVQTNKVPIDLLYQIKSNIKHLYHIFIVNFITPQKAKLQDLLFTNLHDLDIEKLKNTTQNNVYNENDSEQDVLYKALKKLTLNDILNDIYNCQSAQFVNSFSQQNIIVNNHINKFYLLINILKQNFYNYEKGYFFKTVYLNSETQKTVNLSKLIYNIVGTYQNNNDLYVQNVIVYHFFNTILQKLSNQYLKDLYIYDKKTNKFLMKQVIVNDMTYDEFKSKLLKYMNSQTQVNNFIQLNNITKYKHCIVTFVKTAFLFNDIIQNNKKAKEQKINVCNFNILKINFQKYFKQNQFISYLFGKDGKLFLLARLYTDRSLQIQKIRQQLKQLVQQYSYIGTKKIASDLLYQFFINNYSLNESARIHN